jgi:putative hemolysin
LCVLIEDNAPVSHRGPFSLNNPFRHAIPRALASAALPLVERTLGLDALNDVYVSAVRMLPGIPMCDGTLRALGVRVEIDEEDLARIPVDGPLIAIANHPFGVVDGVSLHSILLRARRDVKLFGSTLLARMDAYRDDFFIVDNFSSDAAAARNVSSMKAALRWLKGGGCVGVFPAGEVSHSTRHRRRVCDPPWGDSIARLALRTGAAVVPVFFAGTNSSLFQIAGWLHPRLRTALLARQATGRGVVRVRIGSTIPAGRVSRFSCPTCLNEHLRRRVYVLESRTMPTVASHPAVNGSVRRETPIAPPQEEAVIRREIAALPPQQTLASVGAYSVSYFRGDLCRGLLQEIGRLREITFRGVGEGTGRASDLDRFDPDYVHLFAWRRETGQIVGAYRLGLVDQIVARRGPAGLYTSTLFRYGRSFLERIGPTIELGRSFVAPDFQKDYAPLVLLWRGIGVFVARRPQYRTLLGPVSISARYSEASRQILMSLLRRHAAPRALRDLVTPVLPPRRVRSGDMQQVFGVPAPSCVDEADELIAEVERGRMRMPVLVRQYLKLNAKLLAFNVDPDFSDVTDGLMLADLREVNPAILGRYMGSEASAAYLARHAVA